MIDQRRRGGERQEARKVEEGREGGKGKGKREGEEKRKKSNSLLHLKEAFCLLHGQEEEGSLSFH